MKKVRTGFEPTIFDCYLETGKYDLWLRWLILFPRLTKLRRSAAIHEALREYRKSDEEST